MSNKVFLGKDEINLTEEQMNLPVDTLHPILLEYPFVKKDMTVGEYFSERKYYEENWDDVITGKYEPLWKQNMKSKG